MEENGVQESLSPEAEERALMQQKAKLEEELIAVRDAENKSTACERICSNVLKWQSEDAFLRNDGDSGGEVRNPYHSNTPVASGTNNEGCCMLL
jgi:hypothetical protein